MKTSRALIVLIVFLELAIFACGIKVVYNRHNARNLFIQLEREQQSYNVLLDEKTRLTTEVANLSQPANIERQARNKGFVPVDNNAVVLLKAGSPATKINNLTDKPPESAAEPNQQKQGEKTP